MSTTITAESLATQVLLVAGIPAAHMTTDSEGLPFCDRAGYLITDSGRTFVNVAVIGDSALEESARRAGRDGITQQARTALDGSGWTVKVNEYGHLFAKMDQPKTNCMHCREKVVHVPGFSWMHVLTSSRDCGEAGRPTGLTADPLPESAES